MTEEELLQVIEQAATEGVTELDLSGKELTTLPPEIGKLTKLKMLILGKYQYDENGDIVSTIGNKLSALPAEIGLLNQLEELQIVDNRLASLPEEIGQLVNLQTLDLYRNQLSSLPEEIGQLVNLQTLDLYNNRLSSLPSEFGQLSKLQTLDLSSNQLSSLPREFGQLVNLQTLNLYNNRLTSLPGEIEQLVNLQILYLRSNQLNSLPKEIGQLVNLQVLDLNFNQLRSVPAEIVQLINLRMLDLNFNQLRSVPAEIVQLINLQWLGLSDNRLTSLPREIGQLVNLQWLYLGYNQLSSLPREFGKLVNLQTLYLYNNQLSNLPREFGQLVNLQTLHLSGNQLSNLPREFEQLVNLQTLHLSYNQLSSMPAEFRQLINLQTLDLSYNQLRSLPAEFRQLVNLQTLDLRSNQLSSLPGEISQLPNLKKLDLRSNPVPILPHILGPKDLSKDPGDIHEILDFYFRVQDPNETEPFYEAKFLIVGEGGAGKTSLANKIVDENYKLQSDEKSTEGIDVIQWKFPLANGKDFRVNIWDFGGQEIYHQTHQFFLTERSLYALVADTRQENTDFYWWLKVVELLSDNSPVLIIKNEKQDRQCEVNERQLRGKFTNLKESLATNLANNRGLAEIKQAIQDYITRLPHVGTPLPKLWVRVRAALENDSRNYIEFYQYENLCRTNNLANSEDMKRLSRYLHDLGVCLHFQDDSTLKRWVILKPEWGTTAVYKVLDNKAVKQNLGCFTQDDLADIWKDSEYADMRDELLQLMMRFKLCYPIPNRPNNYIAPQLLDINQPDYNWDENNNLILRYEYEFMPKGIITRFIVETHPWIEQPELVWKSGIVWRSGVVLNKDQTRAEIIENYNQREIKIRVAGNRKKELLAVITHELEKIHKSFERLQYQTLVPCNCQKCEGSQNPYTYPLNELREFVEDRAYQIQCRKSRQMVDVRGLIDDVNLQTFDITQELNSQVTPLQRELEQSRNKSLMHQPQNSAQKEVLISYTWRDQQSEPLVKKIEQAFQAEGIDIIRDTNAIGYKQKFKEFMQRLSRGKCVILIISDQYLKSENCMYELVEIAKDREFYDRIFPIILADAKIYKFTERMEYIRYWQDEINKLREAIKGVDITISEKSLKTLKLYEEIKDKFDELANLLNDINTLTPDIHSQSNFETLLKAIEDRLNG
ncbi:TIR domain-containing protein [Mastigocladus laminosus UU774]|nr:TIR domain-containing protein [Mastigocladus laminosus UU774]